MIMFYILTNTAQDQLAYARLKTILKQNNIFTILFLLAINICSRVDHDKVNIISHMLNLC